MVHNNILFLKYSKENITCYWLKSHEFPQAYPQHDFN
jgi:hypothetical protein